MSICRVRNLYEVPAAEEAITGMSKVLKLVILHERQAPGSGRTAPKKGHGLVSFDK
jgi:hypothetical protein